MTDALLAGELPLPPRPDYLRHGSTVTSWLTTTDHKRIAILYAITITIFFFMGGVAITLVRLELFTPNGGLVTSDTYNKLFSFHGIVMVWFFLVPSIPNTLGNFLLPLMIGAPDVAFPRLNLLSWYLTIAAGVFTVYALVAGGVDTGWTFYTPYSTMFSNSHVLAAAAGVFVVGFASIATGVNFIATTHMLRAPGMTWFRLPLFVWAIYATSIIMVLATPVLAISLLLVIAERWLGLPIFRSRQWRRSDPVPASVLVLLAPCGLYHGAACDGRRIRDHSLLRAPPHLRLRFHGLCDDRDCRDRLLRVGPPHVRVGPIALCQSDLLVSVLHHRRAVGDQGVQLDGLAVPRPDQLRSTDALCAGLRRIVHDRRACRACSSPRSRSTCTSPTPISWSRISTTSWSADRCRPSSPACISGGRR